MPKNEGGLDRILRVLAGAALIVAAFFAFSPTTPLGVGMIAVGAVLALTGLAGFCPAYALFGIRTCAVNTEKAS